MLLGKIRMHLDLKHSWFDLGVGEYFMNNDRVNVAYTYISDKSFPHELFHCMISLFIRHSIIENHLWSAIYDSGIMINPSRWVAFLNRHELQSDRGMY